MVEECQSNLEMKIRIQLANERIQQLGQIIPELDLEIRQLDMQLGARPARPNSDQIAFFDAIKQQRDALDQQRSEAATNLRILIRSQLPNPRQIHDLDIATDRGRASCKSAVDELGGMIKTIEAKFGDLKKNDEVQKALADAGGIKFIHTSEYQNILKQIKQWEAFVKATAERTEPKTEPVAKKKAGMRKRCRFPVFRHDPSGVLEPVGISASIVKRGVGTPLVVGRKDRARS